MRVSWRALPLALFTTSVVLLLTACGLSITNPSLFAGTDSTTSVSITLTGPGTVTLGKQSQYAASVSGSSDATVKWSVNGVAGGNNSIGSISDKGLYSAPTSAPQSSRVTITATSVASPAVSKSLPVALAAPAQPPANQGGSGTPPVTLTVSGATSVTLGTSSTYVAAVTGSGNTAVNWTVNGVTGGDSADGVISATGVYTAPATAPTGSQVTIAAVSIADPSVSDGMTVALTAQVVNPPNPPTPPDPTVTLALSGASIVTLSKTAQYTAVVTGTSDTAVAWSVNGVAGGNTAGGTISQKGFYVAPVHMPQSGTVTITATSQADPSVSQNLVVTLASQPKPPVTITVTLSGPTTVTLGASSQYAAAVTGSTNSGVMWSVDGITGGNASVGTISINGRYIAPSKAPQSSKVTIAATSQANSSVSQSMTVTLAAPPPPVQTVTLALSGATVVTAGKAAQYTAIVTGTTDTAVAWSVNGVAGGDTTLGTISAKGLYVAPAHLPPAGKVTIGASSMADPSVSQSLVVTLASQPTPPVTITVTLSGPTTVMLGTSSQYAAHVTGSTSGVTWSVDGATGGDASVGTISSSGRYTAPSKAPQSSKVTIAATSKANSSVSQSMTVTLAAPPPVQVVTLTLSGPASVTLGTSSQYNATVSGTATTGVKWSVDGIVGGSATDGFITAGGLYTAPSVAPQPSTVTVMATSIADSTVAKSIVTALVAPAGGSRIPANAISSGDLNASTKWAWTHDPGTSGDSQGTSAYPVAGLSADDKAREFYMTFSSGGGEIYHVSFAKDTKATHFVYDVNVYVPNPAQLKNLELDMNDVMSNGQLVILGTQCSGYSKTWEYSLRINNKNGWHASNIPCDPMKWTPKVWHHIQIATHRDNNGDAYYDWVCFDGQYSDFKNANGTNGRDDGWAIGTLLINLQIDGPSKTNGSNTLYTDKLIVWRW